MMRKRIQLFRPQIGLVCFFALLTGCERQIPSNSIQAVFNVQPSKEFTTRCIGRYLIDLPSDLLLTPLGGQTIDGVRLRVAPLTSAEFDRVLSRRRAELAAALTMGEKGDYPALRQTLPLPSGLSGVLFDRAGIEGAAGRMDRVLEVLGWRDGYMITGEIGATDTTFPEDRDNEALHANLKTDVAEKSRRIIDVVSRTRGRTDTEVPAQPGTCIVNGYVLGAPTAGELITAIYQFRQVDNFHLRLSSASLSAGSDTVLDRIEKIRPLIAKSSGKVIRKAKRPIHGQNGYEAAYSMLTDDNPGRGRVMMDRFVFELNSKEGSDKKPRIAVELHNGESISDSSKEIEEATVPLKQAPFTTAAAEAMWDSAISTIRARANAF